MALIPAGVFGGVVGNWQGRNGGTVLVQANRQLPAVVLQPTMQLVWVWVGDVVDCASRELVGDFRRPGVRDPERQEGRSK